MRYRVQDLSRDAAHFQRRASAKNILNFLFPKTSVLRVSGKVSAYEISTYQRQPSHKFPNNIIYHLSKTKKEGLLRDMISSFLPRECQVHKVGNNNNTKFFLKTKF